MPPRLSALDASFLYLEQPTTPMHVGAVSVFRRPRAGFDYDRLVDLVEQRIALVPRYRQKVRYVPGNLARPVWIDDPILDVSAEPRVVPEELWMPRPEPSGAELVLGAVADAVAQPGEIVDNVRVAT